MSLFSAPSTGGDICKPSDVNGHLLIVVAKAFRENVQTSMGVSDAVSVDVADIDTGQVYRGSLWFNVALVNGLRPKIGQGPILATMGQGTAQPGKNPPFMLYDATTDAALVARGEKWLSEHQDFLGSSFSSPAPAAQASAPAPATAPAAQPTLPANAANNPDVAALLQKMLEKQQAGQSS